jgi:hypothetical protein
MKRLWVQQTLAFSLVVIVTMSAVAIWINQSATAEFRKYVTLGKMRTPGSSRQAFQGLEELVAYYQQGGSWAGVDRLLRDGVYVSDDWQSIRLGMTLADDGRAGMLETQPDVLLADADGRVVFDSAGKAIGKPLSRDEMANALPLTTPDDGSVVGHLLLFYPYTAPLGKPEVEYLNRVEQIHSWRGPGRDLDLGDRRPPEPPVERAFASPGGCGPGRRCRGPGAAGQGRRQRRSRPGGPGLQ